MKVDIIEKLRAQLQRLPIDDEPRALYVMAELRKVFEGENSLHDSFPTLSFYMNWALHVTLDRNRALRRFLENVLPVLTLCSQSERDHQHLDSLLTLRQFRDELRTALLHLGLPTDLCDENDAWQSFLHIYADIVADVELTFQGDSSPRGPFGLAVQSLTVRALAGDLRERNAFPMEWDITYTNGQHAKLALSDHGLLGATLTTY